MLAILLAAMGMYYGRVTYKIPCQDGEWQLSAHASLGPAPILSMIYYNLTTTYDELSQMNLMPHPASPANYRSLGHVERGFVISKLSCDIAVSLRRLLYLLSYTSLPFTTLAIQWELHGRIPHYCKQYHIL